MDVVEASADRVREAEGHHPLELDPERSTRVQKLWQSYRDEVMEPGCPPIQYQECRRAFFAGAAGLFGMLTGSVSAGNDVEIGDVTLMEDITAELDAFKRSVLSGDV
jgi:hypothetical protein